MKNLLLSSLALAMLTSALACGHYGIGGAESTKGKLTNAKVQAAVEQAFEAMKNTAAKQGMPFQPGASVRVQGIQEIPGQSSAKVDVNYINAAFKQPWAFTTEYQKVSAGTATLTRYNDGRWVLTELRTDDIMYLSGIKTSIEIQ